MGRFRLDVRREKNHGKGSQAQKRLSREVVESLSLGMFKSHIDLVAIQIWCLGTWFSDRPGGVGKMAGLGDLRAPFWPGGLCDSVQGASGSWFCIGFGSRIMQMKAAG